MQHTHTHTLRGEGVWFAFTDLGLIASSLPVTCSGSFLRLSDLPLVPPCSHRPFRLPPPAEPWNVWSVLSKAAPYRLPRGAVSHSEILASHVLLSVTTELCSLNGTCSSSSSAFSPWPPFPPFSCKFPLWLPSTSPHPAAGTPQISVKLRFCVSADFCTFCQVPSACSISRASWAPGRLPRPSLAGLIRSEPVVRTGPCFPIASY